MLPITERLTRSHLFTKAYNARKSVATPYFTLYVLPRIPKAMSNKMDGLASQIKSNDKNILPMTGFVVSKKTSKSACLRNRMKRRIRESYRLLRGQLPNRQSLNQWYVMILVIKESTLNAPWANLCRTMENAFDEVVRKYGHSSRK